MFQMDAKPFGADVLAAKAGLAQQEARPGAARSPAEDGNHQP